MIVYLVAARKNMILKTQEHTDLDAINLESPLLSEEEIMLYAKYLTCLFPKLFCSFFGRGNLLPSKFSSLDCEQRGIKVK